MSEGPAADPLSNIRIVLVRPRGMANVGAAARAMKNMGLGSLVLVAPATRRIRAAEAMAVHARDIVHAAPIVPDIGAAVADCGLVLGTTCRGGPYRAAVEEAGAAAPGLLAHAARSPVAILFGPEDHGLSNDDLLHCQRLLTIETSPAYSSLNLAQAVLLVCHELRRATAPGGAVAGKPAAAPHHAEPAPAAAVERMYTNLRSALLRIGFLNRQNPDHVMLAIRQLLGRTTLADNEVRILLGIARQIDWYAGAAARQTQSENDVAGGRWPVAAPGPEECPPPAAELADASERPLATGHRSRSSRDPVNAPRRLRHG